MTICGCVDRSVRLLVHALLHEETEGLGLGWTKLQPIRPALWLYVCQQGPCPKPYITVSKQHHPKETSYLTKHMSLWEDISYSDTITSLEIIPLELKQTSLENVGGCDH